MTEPGFYRMSLFDYLKDPAVNRSFLVDLVNLCPDEARWNQEHNEVTDATVLGDATHAAVLEPERFEKEYVVMPADCRPGSGTGMRARKELFMATVERKGQTVIKEDQFQNLREMKEVVYSDDNCTRILCDGEAELSGFYIEPEFNVLCKFRADWLNRRLQMDIDIKTTNNIQHYIFRNHAYEFGYDLQSFMTLRGLAILTGVEHKFRFIVIASKGYHGLKLYDADDDLLRSGEERYFKGLEIYQQCVSSGDWPRYDSTPQPLGVPEFVKNKLINNGF